MPSKIDRTGQRFGRLTALSFSHKNGQKPFWLCQCDCGTQKVISITAAQQGITKSCGCLNSETTAARNFKHGGYGTPEYKSWSGMITRCHNITNQSYPRYGGRGIKVCAIWRKSFSAFLEHVGPRPDHGYSIDRIDNDGNYEPGNVRWATASQQIANRRWLGRRDQMRFKIDGKELTTQEIADIASLTQSAIFARIAKGWPAEKLILPRQR